MNPSTAQAAVIVDELIASGVTDVVLCPGSRSAPLAFALHAADSAGRIRLHVRVDERGAGFLALGLGRATGRAAAVVTTSGSAVANLHPAVLEAHHGGVPLLVLSADRPPRLRDVGANQVIDQLGVFGAEILRYRHDLAVAVRVAGQNGYWRGQVCRALAATVGASGGRPGPAHLNLPFEVPLVPDGDGDDLHAHDDMLRGAGRDAARAGTGDWPESLEGRSGPWTTVAAPARQQVPGLTGQQVPGLDPGPTAVPAPGPGERCLVIADLTHPWAAAVAATGVPLVSEAGGLAGEGVLAAGMHLLADAEFLSRHPPDRVIVLGRPTLFRSVSALLARADIVIDVVDHPASYADLAGNARMVSPRLLMSAAPAAEDGTWAAAWRAADMAARAAIDGLVDEGALSGALLARTVAAALPDGATLFVGSSQSPRDLARFTRPRAGVRVVANRGVAGIDGALSTAIGVALANGDRAAGMRARAEGGSSSTYALLGDLTFLHDVTALAIGPHEPRPDVTIIVANNDGGGIFAALEPGEPRFSRVFERVFGTPTGAQIGQLAEAFGAEHVLAMTVDELAEEISMEPEGVRVVEVPISRTDLREFDAAVQDAVRASL